MGLAERIAEVERQVADQREAVTAASARLRGLEAELESLRRAVATVGALTELSRTDAIEAVLRDANTALSPAEVVERLHAGGRAEDTAKDVNATLIYLLKEERVVRPSRGRYLAI